jgi:hypothetical protein
MTAIFATFGVVSFCLVSIFQVCAAAECKEVEYTSDKCRSSSYIKIASQRVNKGSEDVRIKLTGSQGGQATWFCGTDKESVKWGGKDANQIRVNFLTDGTVQWTIYNCDDLSGPVEAGIECSDEAYSTACPGGTNDTCVFEVSTSTSFIDKTTTTVQVSAEVTKQVTSQAQGKISGSITQERSQAKVIEYNHKSYLIIPSGFKFCSFSNAKSVKDVLAPTGYKWQCSGTNFVQAKLSYNGPCSKLSKCPKHYCIPDAPGGAAKSAFSFLLFILTQAAFVVFAF